MADRDSSDSDSKPLVQRGRRHRARPPLRADAYRPSAPVGDVIDKSLDQLSPLELYRREKALRAGQRRDDDAMAAAKREYRAMLEADAARHKGGRPPKAR